MRHQGGQLQRMLRTLRGHGGWLSVWLLAAGWLALPSLGIAAEGAPAGPVEYRDIPGIGSRNIVWVIAQLHLLLAGFVLGVPIFAWLCEIVGWKSGEKRYDKLAKEFTKLLTSSYATTALFGGILLVPADRVLSEADELPDGYLFPFVRLLLHPLPARDGHALSLLVWLGRHAGRRSEDVSHFPGVPAEPLRVLHHDRAELLGHVPSESGRDRRRHGLGAGLGRNLESDLVAGQHPSTDRQRRARRLYLRCLCRHPVSGGPKRRGA